MKNKDYLYHKKKFLIGQLGSFGDCLYATTIARQLKNDYPDSYITWAIGTIYRSIIDNNPYIDDIWEYPISNRDELLSCWENFQKEAWIRKNKGDYDEIFLTQVFPGNIKYFDGTLRSAIFRAYNKPITVPLAPVVQLYESEIKNVHAFAQSHKLENFKTVILFECSPKSGQSFVTWDFAYNVASNITHKHKDLCIILSSNEAFHSNNKQIIDGSVLSFRENAELTKFCSLLIGCSSGISWLCTSEYAKPLPMIQLIKKETSMYASFIYDHEYHGIQSDMIIEMSECTPSTLIDCIEMIFSQNFALSRLKYHQKIPLDFKYYATVISLELLQKRKYKDALLSLKFTIKRYGLKINLLTSFIKVICKSKWLQNNLINKLGLKHL
ncbi:hypothetical protein Mhun_2128 [Methanospirillum hungatei JF-1]|uniref:ADP-heptose:LPS heptosyltransferase-like protein n=1 Tax=Methanospirillum hungatei JF-1 (strain ATCC 27890 / DSM 864 / NBRC 100397 / JF-1) TaxID=323259 RepID=Q2FN92_METHJ|nr:hypothetical protein [Methanospirillum hungatei]ABD41835.1 hypothetical protein Mhun_2128 [Methanospirillum hungatei JF-1]